jgi:hypothetical protein
MVVTVLIVDGLITPLVTLMARIVVDIGKERQMDDFTTPALTALDLRTRLVNDVLWGTAPANVGEWYDRLDAIIAAARQPDKRPSAQMMEHHEAYCGCRGAQTRRASERLAAQQPDERVAGERCATCDGQGWHVESAHDPRCDGTCAVGCPVPVQAQCTECSGTGHLPPPAAPKLERLTGNEQCTYYYGDNFGCGEPKSAHYVRWN